MNMKLAIVGVTGMVGAVILKVLAERNFPITELIPVASEKSCGKGIHYLGKEHTIISLIELDVDTFDSNNIPDKLKNIEAIKPGSRFLKA